MAAEGADLGGEARLVDAMVAPGSRLLDAGCGTGRTAAVLHARGHRVVGVDADPVLIAAAEADHPGPAGWWPTSRGRPRRPRRARPRRRRHGGQRRAFVAPAPREPC
jgi:SAM-dependent methyltransferase